MANALRLLEFALAYNLARAFGMHLKGTPLEGASVETIRTRLLKIGARVVCSVRRVVIHLAEGYPLKDLFARVLGRLRAVPALWPASG